MLTGITFWGLVKLMGIVAAFAVKHYADLKALEKQTSDLLAKLRGEITAG